MGRVSADLWGGIQIEAVEERTSRQVGALEKETEGEGRASTWSPLPPPSLLQPWAVCQEDAANLASRAWAILNEQREPAVQMDEAQPSESEALV